MALFTHRPLEVGRLSDTPLQLQTGQCKTFANVVILSRLVPGSGNLSTAKRIKMQFCRSYFDATSHHCCTENEDRFKSAADFHDYLSLNNVHAVIGIHAYRAGRLLCGSPVPYALVFGGTDINVYSEQPQKMAVMTTAVNGASWLVALGPAVVQKVLSFWPQSQRDRLLNIPQAVITVPTPFPRFDPRSEFKLEPENPLFFTLVAGIRPVKDPLYLVRTFSEWHRNEAPNAYLVIVGSALDDEEYGQKFLQEIECLAGVIHVGLLPTEEAHSLIQRSFALLNTSLSEGMCTAILEAQQLGVPVLVRHIPANAVLVEDGVTGLLFTSPQEFLTQATRLMADEDLCLRLIDNAKRAVNKNYNCERESLAYHGLVTNMIQDLG